MGWIERGRMYEKDKLATTHAGGRQKKTRPRNRMPTPHDYETEMPASHAPTHTCIYTTHSVAGKIWKTNRNCLNVG